MVYNSTAQAGVFDGVIDMPLTRRQFELGIDEESENWMRQVYELLENQRHLAYSSEELREAVLGQAKDSSKVEKFGRALDVLAEISAVDKRWLDETEYYAYLQEFDTGTWKSAKLPVPPPPPTRSSS